MTALDDLLAEVMSEDFLIDTRPKEWRAIGPLHRVFARGFCFDDDDVAENYDELRDVAVRYLCDVRRLVGSGNRSSFVRDMVSLVCDDDRPLSTAQVRGTLNVLGGQLRRHRGRFYKSRHRRRDRHDGLRSCLVCGGPLKDHDSAERGVGPTCYEHLLRA